ncbi:MAG: DUF167 domain-containing protein [Candidatus Nanoarchaeia archaeon]|nr:DUF167 domain-containing protein [Candidatus Nanoarchaeia archaeon]
MKIYVKVKPSSGRQEIIKEEDNYTVYLKSPPEDNKANVELAKLLHNYFRADVRIKSGWTSRNKIVEIIE